MNRDIIFLRFRRAVFEKFAHVTAQQVFNRGIFEDFIADIKFVKKFASEYLKGTYSKCESIATSLVFTAPRSLFFLFAFSLSLKEENEKEKRKGHLEIMEILRTRGDDERFTDSDFYLLTFLS